MIRYMSVIGDGQFDIEIKHELENPVWCLSEKPPEVPYIKLEIKIVGKEKRYAHEGRPRKPKKRRFLIFGKEK